MGYFKKKGYIFDTNFTTCTLHILCANCFILYDIYTRGDDSSQRTSMEIIFFLYKSTCFS